MKQRKRKLIRTSIFTIVILLLNAILNTYPKTVQSVDAGQISVIEEQSEIPKRISLTVENIKQSEEQFIIGWTNENVDVREEPNENSKVIMNYIFNSKISYIQENDKWVKIKNDNGYIGYIEKEYINNAEVKSESYNISSPNYSGTKTWMGYLAVTNTSSPQYNLLRNYSYTGDYGIRMINNRYCVAIGSHFNASIGQYFDLILENGTVIPCIKGDEKSDTHTDNSNIFTIANSTYCCSEFITDAEVFRKANPGVGDVSRVNENWQSPVIAIIVYDKKI